MSRFSLVLMVAFLLSLSVSTEKSATFDEMTFDFEKSSQGWVVVSDKLDGIDDSNLKSLIRKSWKPIAGSFAVTNNKGDAVGNVGLGVIESPVITLSDDRSYDGLVTFKHSGGITDKAYFAVFRIDGTEIARAENSRVCKLDSDEASGSFDLSKFKGQNIYFRLVDKSAQAWGFKLVDDLVLNGKVNKNETKKRNSLISGKIPLNYKVDISLEEGELSWTVNNEAGIKKFHVKNSKDGKVIQSINPVDADFYSIKVPKAISVCIQIEALAGLSKPYLPKTSK